MQKLEGFQEDLRVYQWEKSRSHDELQNMKNEMMQELCMAKERLLEELASATTARMEGVETCPMRLSLTVSARSPALYYYEHPCYIYPKGKVREHHGQPELVGSVEGARATARRRRSTISEPYTHSLL